MPRKRPEDLRSHRWFGVQDLRAFAHRSRALQMGYTREDFSGKPVIAIVNTWSDLNPCHAHFKQRVEEVKRGVWQAGGFPVEMPAMSLAEPMQKPTTMMYRNFLAMETEELLRRLREHDERYRRSEEFIRVLLAEKQPAKVIVKQTLAQCALGSLQPVDLQHTHQLDQDREAAGPDLGTCLGQPR